MKPFTFVSHISTNFNVMHEKQLMMIEGIKQWQNINAGQFPDVAQYDLHFIFTEMPYIENGKEYSNILEIKLTVYDKSNFPF